MAKKKETNMVFDPDKWPAVNEGNFVCSDGTIWKDGYYAREHQKSLNCIVEDQNQNKQQNGK